MPTESPNRAKDSCPHCNKSVGLHWWYLLPSGDRNRVLKCQACGGKFNLSDNSKIASMMGGLLGLAPCIFLFGRIVQAGHGSKLYVVAATAVVALGFGLSSMLVARLTLSLKSKP